MSDQCQSVFNSDCVRMGKKHSAPRLLGRSLVPSWKDCKQAIYTTKILKIKLKKEKWALNH